MQRVAATIETAGTARPLASLRMLAFSLLGLLFFIPSAKAAWTEYRIGPLYVISDAGDRAARERLTRMEQIRYVLGNLLGDNAIGSEELDAIWPIKLVLFNNARDAEQFRPATPFIEGGSANLSVAHDDDDPYGADAIAFRHQVVRQLLDANAGALPPDVETALADLFSMIQVEEATKVALGAPFPQALLDAGFLSPERLRGWQRFQMLATGSDYAGRLRIYLNNLQGGDLDLAARNSFGVRGTELEARMEAYADAGTFTPASVFGKPINPNRDFYERRMEDAEAEALLEELAAGGNSFPPESPRGLVAAGDIESLRLAAARNPKWALPHVLLADYESNPEAKAQRFAQAVELEPRQVAYWEGLAENYTAAEMFTEAARAWLGAQRAAATEDERARLNQRRRDIEQQRVDSQLAAAEAARRAAEAESERVRLEAQARVQAVLDRVNQENAELSTAAAPAADQAVAFDEAFGGAESLRGMLTAVGCVDGLLRLIVQQPGGELAVLRMAPPEGNVAEDDPFRACGQVEPARRIQINHDGIPNSGLGTIGTVESYQLLD